ncbi:MAG: diguanylate cyclase [Candidatus Omnitrophota bacterium]|jgi:diguanylate cyclase (GGDEF)-like protein|nr:MAG: diguanylate cyclase [Candidatus Omnitrophota bacterium]
MGKNNGFNYSRGLKYKLRIAVSLMSVLPLLVCLYLVSNYVLPQAGIKMDVAFSVIISIFISVIGFIVIKEIFDRVLMVSNDAKLIAAGDITRRISLEKEDEVGELGEALNQLTQRIRLNMDELKNYGEKTTEINLEIQRRVLVLSSLLQISSLISQGAKLEDILKVVVEKSRLLANSEVAFLLYREDKEDSFSMKIVDGANSQRLMGIQIGESGVFNKSIKSNKPLIIDKHNILPAHLIEEFDGKFGLRNALALPIYLRGRVTGILAIGNNKEDFLYNKDDMELLDIFAKQTAIAVENDILVHRVEKLEIKDALTGLYNESYIRNRLQEEIKRAIVYQRPCSFVLMDVDNFKNFHDNFGLLQAESALKKIANLIKDSASEVDRVARFGDNCFAMVLPEKNKRQSQDIAEDIRRKIEFSFGEDSDVNKRLTVSGGVSENPLDGIETGELISKAKDYLELAKKKGKNRILATDKN